MNRGFPLAILLLPLLLGVSIALACKPSARVIRMATTTSTANTGLLDVLLEEFRADTGIRVDYVATGTGQALMHGRNGDVDVVLVHAPPAEESFVQDGAGVERVPVMWNDFVVVGPPGDPAGVGDQETAAQGFAKISQAQASFVSRGDDSGTHKKELEIWAQAGVEPGGVWYIEAGQGMGACLTMANEKMAYLLSDRGTYLSMADQLELVVTLEGDPVLHNPYSIIAVNPEKYPEVDSQDVARLIAWITSPKAQRLIADYRVNGHQLFHPAEEVAK